MHAEKKSAVLLTKLIFTLLNTVRERSKSVSRAPRFDDNSINEALDIATSPVNHELELVEEEGKSLTP
jgi:hypothetical protein